MTGLIHWGLLGIFGLSFYRVFLGLSNEQCMVCGSGYVIISAVVYYMLREKGKVVV